MTYRNRKILDLAEDRPCMNCGAQDKTVVAAHSNMQEHGRGHAHQADDCFVAWLCWRCHSWLDHGSGQDPTGMYDCTKSDKALMFRRAMEATWREMWKSGLVKVA